MGRLGKIIGKANEVLEKWQDGRVVTRRGDFYGEIYALLGDGIVEP